MQYIRKRHKALQIEVKHKDFPQNLFLCNSSTNYNTEKMHFALLFPIFEAWFAQSCKNLNKMHDFAWFLQFDGIIWIKINFIQINHETITPCFVFYYLIVADAFLSSCLDERYDYNNE